MASKSGSPKSQFVKAVKKPNRRHNAAAPAKALASVRSPRAKRGSYVSDSILARRRRMLDVAKEMIAEGGPEGFTIRELGRRARVSVTTIYSTYGDKEGLIAAAIEDFYQRLPLARGPSPMTLPGLLEAIDEACKAVFGNKPYARHYVDLYFSGTVDPRIYKVIQDTARAAAGCQPWLQKTMRDGDTIAGFDMDYVMNLLTNNRLIGLQDWARGRIDDKQLAIEAKISFLSIVRGITRGATQDRVDAALKTCLRMATAARLQ